MKLDSIKPYLRHYGSIKTLRASVMRSTFARVQAGFDTYDSTAAVLAMRVLDQNPVDLACAYCGGIPSGWDHLLPAARGGTHQIRNLVPCCTTCNATKGVKTWQAFLDEQPETEATLAARSVLEEYTKGFVPEASCVTSETAAELTKILAQIIAKMAEADALIDKDIRAQT